MRLDRPILALALGQAFVWAGSFYAFPSLLIFWEDDLGWSKAELTAAFTAGLLVSAIFSPLTGRLIDRGRGPLVIAGSMILTALLVAALSFADSYAFFFAVWALMGLGLSGALYDPCFALITRARGPGARRAITAITLAGGFAGTLSFPIGHVVAEAFGWRTAVWVYAAMILLIAMPATLWGARRLEATRIEEPALDAGQPKGASHAFMRNPAFWMLAFAFAAIGLNHGSILHHIRPLLDERGILPDTAVLAASMIGPMQVFGRLAVMSFERHLSNNAVAILCFLGLIVGPLLLLTAGVAPALLAAFVILQGSAWGVTSIIKPVITRDIMGQQNFGVINGALALPFLTTMALAPFAGSLLWELGGYGLMLLFACGAAVVGLSCFLVAVKLHGRAQS